MPNANRDKGLRAERAVAAYFRDHGLAGAERSVSTGWSTKVRSLADLGDLRGISGICVQVKDVTGTGPLVGKALDSVLAETAQQCAASGSVIPLLIEKRKQVADVGQWYAWLPSGALAALVIGTYLHGEHYPVRVELRYVIHSLVKFSKWFADSESGYVRAI